MVLQDRLLHRAKLCSWIIVNENTPNRVFFATVVFEVFDPGGETTVGVINRLDIIHSQC